MTRTTLVLRFGLFGVGCFLVACQEPAGLSPKGGQERALKLAADIEVFVSIKVGGVPLQSFHGQHSASLIALRTTHGGSGSNRVITKKPCKDQSFRSVLWRAHIVC